HSYCYGLRVLGTLEDLAQIHAKHHLGKIVVCADSFQPQERDTLLNFCKTHDIRLTRYRCTEVDYS
ncbi:MAG: hypothetical protein IKS92_00785, partial [Victivallales bacterium]|nr:hypothetical protein [Victivallales bacterium]